MQNRATTQEEVERRVEEWHDSKEIKITLAAHLGWTEEEYKKWLETNELPNPDLRQIND